MSIKVKCSFVVKYCIKSNTHFLKCIENIIKDFLHESFVESNVTPKLSMEWKVKQARIAFDASVFAKHKLLMEEDLAHPSVLENICRSKNGGRGRNERTFLNHVQLSIGPTYSGAPLHSHVAAWNIVFQGVKKWVTIFDDSSFFLSDVLLPY